MTGSPAVLNSLRCVDDKLLAARELEFRIQKIRNKRAKHAKPRTSIHRCRLASRSHMCGHGPYYLCIKVLIHQVLLAAPLKSIGVSQDVTIHGQS